MIIAGIFLIVGTIPIGRNLVDAIADILRMAKRIFDSQNLAIFVSFRVRKIAEFPDG
jgi:hypothetical protein